MAIQSYTKIMRVKFVYIFSTCWEKVMKKKKRRWWKQEGGNENVATSPCRTQPYCAVPPLILLFDIGHVLRWCFKSSDTWRAPACSCEMSFVQMTAAGHWKQKPHKVLQIQSTTKEKSFLKSILNYVFHGTVVPSEIIFFCFNRQVNVQVNRFPHRHQTHFKC